MTKAVFFDFDGVLHDTFEFHRAKIHEYSGVDFSVEVFKEIHEGNFYATRHKEVHDIDWMGYRDYIYQDQVDYVIREEYKEVLREIKNNHDLFIVTSGGTKNITNCLNNNDLQGIFKEVLGAETHRLKTDKFKHLFNSHGLFVDDCVFVTDTLGDILEANEMNLKTIAVDFGYHEKNVLQKGAPWKIVSKFDEITLLLTNFN